MRLLNRLASAALFLGCLATLLMMVHVSLDVVGRLLFKQAVGGTLETVTYIYMVAVVFLPLAMVQRQRQQIIVEIFSQVFSPRVLSLLDGTVALIGCVFMALVTWFSANEAWAQTLIRETAPSTHNPVAIWPARWFVVAGAVMVAAYMAVQASADLFFALTGRRASFDDRIQGAGQPVHPIQEI